MASRPIDLLKRAPGAVSAPEPSHDRPWLASRLGRVVRWALGAVLGMVAMSILMTAIYGILPVGITPLMLIRLQENLVGGRDFRLEKRWVPMTEISTNLQAAVIAAEDVRFFEHAGFDWEAIEKARKHNARSRRVRGASTISQQVAKNVFLWPNRSWLRKGIEVYFTFLIETMWSKKRIMEVYLNVVELGDGVYGVEAASRKYFGKPSSRLNPYEAALLAAVLPNPRQYRVARPSSYVRFRQTLIRRRMWDAARSIPNN